MEEREERETKATRQEKSAVTYRSLSIMMVFLGLIGVVWICGFFNKESAQPVRIEIIRDGVFRVGGELSHSPKNLRELLGLAHETYPHSICYNFASEVSGETVFASLNAAAEMGFSKIALESLGSSKVIHYENEKPAVLRQDDGWFDLTVVSASSCSQQRRSEN